MNLTVTYRGGTKFHIHSHAHMIVADQPRDDGGTDAGMSPVELFIGSLGSCVAYFVAQYCARHGIASEGLVLDVNYDVAEQPHRVGRVAVRIHLPASVNPSQEERLLRVAQACTVHQSLLVPPTVDIRLAAKDHTAA
jgi:uncharacterized OsmC-like protein